MNILVESDDEEKSSILKIADQNDKNSVSKYLTPFNIWHYSHNLWCTDQPAAFDG